MVRFHDAWLAHQARRFTRPDAHRWLRPDRVRFEQAEPYCERKFDPDQLRVPAGNPEGGQWTGGGAGPAFGAARPVAAAMVPKIPGIRPPNPRDFWPTVRLAAGWIRDNVTTIGEIATAAPWLISEAGSHIRAYLDEPRSLTELQEAVSSPQRGYDVHHIVEKTAAEQSGYPSSRINGPDNLVLIPTLKHWEINAWFQTRNPQFDNMSPRDYLKYKHWDERRRIGLLALTIVGVLRP